MEVEILDKINEFVGQWGVKNNNIIEVVGNWNGKKILTENDDDIYKKFDGLTFGIGMQRMFGAKKQHGLDISLMYIATSGAFEYAENEGIGSPPNIGLSFHISNAVNQ